MPQTTKVIKHGDFTGKERAKLQAEYAEEQARQAQSMAMATAVQQTAKNEVVDYTNQKGGRKRGRPEAAPKPVLQQDGDGTVEEVDDPTIAAILAKAGAQPGDDVVDGATDYADDYEQPEEALPAKAEIRALADLEQVTIGVGTMFDFEYGRRYVVPWNVAFHLNEQGYCDILKTYR